MTAGTLVLGSPRGDVDIGVEPSASLRPLGSIHGLDRDARPSSSLNDLRQPRPPHAGILPGLASRVIVDPDRPPLPDPRDPS